MRLLKKHLLPVLLVACFGSGFSGVVQAQLCETPAEVITTLFPPRLGFPAVWDATYGQRERMVQLTASVPLASGTVLAAGRILDGTDYKPLETVLVELNRRGRAVREVSFPAKPAEAPVRLIPQRDGFVMGADIRGGPRNKDRQVRLSWYDASLSYRKQLILRDDDYDYTLDDLVPAAGGEEGFLAALRAVRRPGGETADRYGFLVRVDAGGDILWKRSYRPGVANAIRGVLPLETGGYLATGQIRSGGGGMAGWVLRLSAEGAILWQEAYPRGADAHLDYAASDGPEGFVLTGEISPLDRLLPPHGF